MEGLACAGAGVRQCAQSSARHCPQGVPLHAAAQGGPRQHVAAQTGLGAVYCCSHSTSPRNIVGVQTTVILLLSLMVLGVLLGVFSCSFSHRVVGIGISRRLIHPCVWYLSWVNSSCWASSALSLSLHPHPHHSSLRSLQHGGPGVANFLVRWLKASAL